MQDAATTASPYVKSALTTAQDVAAPALRAVEPSVKVLLSSILYVMQPLWIHQHVTNKTVLYCNSAWKQVWMTCMAHMLVRSFMHHAHLSTCFRQLCRRLLCWLADHVPTKQATLSWCTGQLWRGSAVLDCARHQPSSAGRQGRQSWLSSRGCLQPSQAFSDQFPHISHLPRPHYPC